MHALPTAAAEVYNVALGGTLTLAATLALLARPWAGGQAPRDVGDDGNGVETALSAGSLALVFLPVWCFCVAGDWLQGPYVFALYQSYGLPREEIARLFVAGFGASFVVGTFAGSLVDRVGRKRGCQFYCLLYIVSCITKHFGNFWVLLLGRLTGGVATSLLFSAFEAWLIREDELQRTTPRGGGQAPLAGPSELQGVFFLMWFASSVIAIAAGPAGDAVVRIAPLAPAGLGTLHFGGLTAAFDLAIVLLLAGLALLSTTWRENRGEDAAPERPGDAVGGADAASQLELFARAARTIAADPPLLALMSVVAGFESAMYAFIFNWTPALTDGATFLPALGSVFSTLMLAYMCGSLTFQLLGNSNHMEEGSKSEVRSPIALLQVALTIAPFALLASSLALSQLEAGSGDRTAWVLGGFVAFEFACGLYAPAMSAVKGRLVAEGVRSTVYNIYRAPMNLCVLALLLSGRSTEESLLAGVGLLSLAAVAGATLPSNGSARPPAVLAGPDGSTAAPAHEEP